MRNYPVQWSEIARCRHSIGIGESFRDLQNDVVNPRREVLHPVRQCIDLPLISCMVSQFLDIEFHQGESSDNASSNQVIFAMGQQLRRGQSRRSDRDHRKKMGMPLIIRLMIESGQPK